MGITTHPGRTLKKELLAREISQKEAAKAFGISAPHLSDIINGKRSISPELAITMETVFEGVEAIFWINLQGQYDLAEARNRLHTEIAEEDISTDDDGVLRRCVPQAYLEELGYWKDDLLERTKFLQRLYGVKKLVEIEGLLSPSTMQKSYFRKSNLETSDIHQLAWERIARYEAGHLEVQEFNVFRKDELIGELKKLFWRHFENSKINVTEESGKILANHGIRFVVVPKPPKGPFDGYAFNFQDDPSLPAIAMTLRHKRLDNFAFTLFHELGHVFKHLSTPGYMSHFDIAFDEQRELGIMEIEEEADKFAMENLISRYVWEDFKYIKKTDDSILHFAERTKVHPGILRGWLCFENPNYYKRRTIITELNRI